MIDVLVFSMLEFGWDEIFMICMGFAAVAVVYSDYRRERDVLQTLLDHERQLGRLESNSDDSLALEVRMVEVEAHVKVSERQEERLSNLQERVGKMEQRLDQWEEDVDDHDEEGNFEE